MIYTLRSRILTESPFAYVRYHSFFDLDAITHKNTSQTCHLVIENGAHTVPDVGLIELTFALFCSVKFAEAFSTAGLTGLEFASAVALSSTRIQFAGYVSNEIDCID